MAMTTNHKTPNFPEDGPRDIRKTYIEHTTGVWIRQLIEKNEIELWYDGVFVASWTRNSDLPVDAIDGSLASGMMIECVRIGERKRAAAIKALIG